MRTRSRTLLVGILLAAAFTTVGSKDVASANHADGHLWTWGVGIPALNQNVVGGVATTVCSSTYPSSTQSAISVWNSALGVTAFTYSSSCSGVMIVVDNNFPEICGDPDVYHGCAAPQAIIDAPYYAISFSSTGYIHLNSAFHPSDGTSHATRDLTHELGHMLGFDEYTNCSTASIMDQSESAGCTTATIQSLDLSNYHNAYQVTAASSPSVSTPGAQQVSLSWYSDDIHNEGGYAIRRWSEWAGWSIPWWVDWNNSAASQSGVPSGYWYYAVDPWTYAESASVTWGGYVGNWVTIAASGSPPSAPTLSSCGASPSCSFTDNATTEDRFRIYWYRWNGSSWIYIQTAWDNNPLSGSGSTFTSYPSSPAHGYWYGAIAAACSDAGGCSGNSSFGSTYYP